MLTAPGIHCLARPRDWGRANANHAEGGVLGKSLVDPDADSNASVHPVEEGRLMGGLALPKIYGGGQVLGKP